MPNHYFQFKQFRIDQEYCAMKVCTDACLFGAWMVAQLKNSDRSTSIQRILDIGAGTGLLSLMLAQETPAHIDAVEIDEAASRQASDNFSASAFASKLQLIHADVREISENFSYDCIVSNPPFFEADLKSPDAKRNLAMHSDELSLTQLIEASEKRLNTDGIFGLILPYHRKQEMLDLSASKGFYPISMADVRQTSKHPFFRTFICFSKKAETLQSETIIISDDRVYSDRFKSLLQNYYLAF